MTSKICFKHSSKANNYLEYDCAVGTITICLGSSFLLSSSYDKITRNVATTHYFIILDIGGKWVLDATSDGCVSLMIGKGCTSHLYALRYLSRAYFLLTSHVGSNFLLTSHISLNFHHLLWNNCVMVWKIAYPYYNNLIGCKFGSSLN